MAANTGRTTKQFVEFHIDDSSGSLREIAVDTVNGVGITNTQVDLTATMDAIKGVLPETPDCVINIAGPFDTSASTGSHTVLNGINGKLTPLTLDVKVGIRQTWESGEPQFGITSSSTVGFLCFDYSVDVIAGKYTATFRMFPGSSAPAWGTSAES